MSYVDTFQPRPFQAEVIDKVLDNHAEGVRTTVVLASPGSGKTITYQAVACELLRANVIDYVVVLVPRITLARQCELDWRTPAVDRPRRNVIEDWRGDFELFDGQGRIEFIEHTPNRVPLLAPGPRGRGLVSTYSSLVSPQGQMAFEAFAQQYEGRFLLVADEAQFCATTDDGNDGTRAGAMMEMLHHYAAHTLLMTGTPYRSDSQPLILAEYGPTGENGLRPLIFDVESTYQDGVRERYLRQFEATFIDSKVRKREVAAKRVIEYNLSDDGSHLSQVLRRPEVWQNLANEVVAAVRDKQNQHPDYRGLISCMEKRDAREVYNYLCTEYPGLRVSIATSEDNEAAERALQAFKDDPADVLVTVRKAFIGYDCKSITVVGVLTHYRDAGHLMQLVGRGLRAWSKEPVDDQMCRIIAPDDPGMQQFVKVMRRELEEGLRERAEMDSELDGDGTAESTDGPTVVVEDAMPIGRRAIGNDVELDSAQLLLIDSLAREHGITAERTKLSSFIQAYTGTKAPISAPDVVIPQQQVKPKTTAQRIAEINAETHQTIRMVISRLGVKPEDPAFSELAQRITGDVNKRAGANAKVAKANEEAATRRLAVAKQFLSVSTAGE